MQPKLEYLTLLCLSNCENLTTIPSLSHCTNLEHILLSGCKTLTELPQDIQFLKNLVTLDARNCLNLELVPSKLNSKLLKQLLLSNCPKVLVFVGTNIKTLPSCISELKQLTYLDLSNSTSLELVPATISELGNLSELVLIGCGSNVSLPELLPPNLKLVKKSNSMTSTFRAMVKIFGEQIFNYKMVDYGSSRLIGNSLVVNASQQQALPCSIC
ncbi:Probable disease resistance protein RPP1 [Linum perenne]